MDQEQKDKIREAYMFVFDAFATDPVSVADGLEINTRYARELLGVLVNHDLVVVSEVNGHDQVWQTANTYDDSTRDEAERRIDAFLAQYQPTNQEVPDMAETATTQENDKAKTNPADLPYCKCGCGSPVGRKSNYKPGHDARHAGNIARKIAETENMGLLDGLPSEALKIKARAMAEGLLIKRRAATERTDAKIEREATKSGQAATPEPTPQPKPGPTPDKEARQKMVADAKAKTDAAKKAAAKKVTAKKTTPPKRG